MSRLLGLFRSLLRDLEATFSAGSFWEVLERRADELAAQVKQELPEFRVDEQTGPFEFFDQLGDDGNMGLRYCRFVFPNRDSQHERTVFSFDVVGRGVRNIDRVCEGGLPDVLDCVRHWISYLENLPESGGGSVAVVLMERQRRTEASERNHKQRAEQAGLAAEQFQRLKVAFERLSAAAVAFNKDEPNGKAAFAAALRESATLIRDLGLVRELTGTRDRLVKNFEADPTGNTDSVCAEFRTDELRLCQLLLVASDERTPTELEKAIERFGRLESAFPSTVQGVAFDIWHFDQIADRLENWRPRTVEQVSNELARLEGLREAVRLDQLAMAERQAIGILKCDDGSPGQLTRWFNWFHGRDPKGTIAIHLDGLLRLLGKVADRIVSDSQQAADSLDYFRLSLLKPLVAFVDPWRQAEFKRLREEIETTAAKLNESPGLREFFCWCLLERDWLDAGQRVDRDVGAVGKSDGWVQSLFRLLRPQNARTWLDSFFVHAKADANAQNGATVFLSRLELAYRTHNELCDAYRFGQTSIQEALSRHCVVFVELHSDVEALSVVPPQKPLRQFSETRSSMDGPGDLAERRQGNSELLPSKDQLPKSQRLAYLAACYAEQRNERQLTDREAWVWLTDNGIKGVGELDDYKLPLPDTFADYLNRARRTLGEKRKQPRGGRNGKSVVRQSET